MTKNVELQVLTDREGRILASAQPGKPSEGAPKHLGFTPQEGQRVFTVEVPAEEAAEARFPIRLSTDYQVDLEQPVRAKLRSLRAG